MGFSCSCQTMSRSENSGSLTVSQDSRATQLAPLLAEMSPPSQRLFCLTTMTRPSLSFTSSSHSTLLEQAASCEMKMIAANRRNSLPIAFTDVLPAAARMRNASNVRSAVFILVLKT